MAESPKRLAVGYAIPPKKQESFIQPSLLRLARDRGLDLIPIDPSRPLSDQGPFHCIIHKLYTDEWKAQVRLHASQHPGVPIVDDPNAIERLHNRISMLEAVSHLETPQGTETLGIPRQAVVYDSDSLSDSSAIGALRFPVIAKPLAADGSAKSHKMALLFQPDALLNLKPPVVLQEFVNHGGVIFKVYVVGDYVKCVKRKSLPDVSKEQVESSEGSLSFSQVSNKPMPPDQAEEDLEAAEMPPESFVTEIARGLGRAMGLRLFNFDMIRDAEAAGHYLIIDVNYFPGYAKMPDYETVLTDFFLNLVRKKREEDVPGSSIGDDEKEEIF